MKKYKSNLCWSTISKTFSIIFSPFQTISINFVFVLVFDNLWVLKQKVIDSNICIFNFFNKKGSASMSNNIRIKESDRTSTKYQD